jgi:hypothetical protein
MQKIILSTKMEVCEIAKLGPFSRIISSSLSNSCEERLTTLFTVFLLLTLLMFINHSKFIFLLVRTTQLSFSSFRVAITSIVFHNSGQMVWANFKSILSMVFYRLSGGNQVLLISSITRERTNL